jgi:hypothetical protein
MNDAMPEQMDAETHREASNNTPGDVLAPACSDQFTFFLLSCRHFEVDWRVPFFEALRNQANFYHIRLGRLSILTDTRTGASESYRPSAVFHLMRVIATKRCLGTTSVYFVSMATALPSLVIGLRLALRRGIWLFDVYDDFSLYRVSWLNRLKGHLVNFVFYRIMTATIIAPPNLVRKFPRAYNLEIASRIQSIDRCEVDFRKILITSNFDRRLDLDFIRGVALELPECEIHMYGRIPDAGHNLPRLDALLSSAENIRYHGEFAEADLPSILANYCVALAPFQKNVPFTRSTDPARFYDYLNAGLEVISTDIPRARDRADFLHIAADPAEAAEILKALQIGIQNRKATRWNCADHSWAHRSRQFLAILEQIALKKKR